MQGISNACTGCTGGCFWGLELAYQRVPGVIKTSVGAGFALIFGPDIVIDRIIGGMLPGIMKIASLP
jgi:hypothetical protein